MVEPNQVNPNPYNPVDPSTANPTWLEQQRISTKDPIYQVPLSHSPHHSAGTTNPTELVDPETPQVKITTPAHPKPVSKDEDPPLITVTNPVTYLKRWWKKIMSNEGIDIGFKFRVKPVTAVIIAAFFITNGVTFSMVKLFFPNSSPILHREVMYQGNLQKGDTGFLLTLPNSDLYTLKPKANSNINFQNLSHGQVLVKGNLGKEKFVIEVSEIIPLESFSQSSPIPTPLNLPTIPNQELLPKLYPGFLWETTQRKVIIFTSGKRKIEQEGVYLESVQLNSFPQDFINYYTIKSTLV